MEIENPKSKIQNPKSKIENHTTAAPEPSKDGLEAAASLPFITSAQ
jgi:hypothetical protein